MIRVLVAFAVLAILLTGASVAQDKSSADKPEPQSETTEKEGEKAAETEEREAEPGIQFLHSLDDAKKQAAEQKKKLFIVFGTPT